MAVANVADVSLCGDWEAKARINRIDAGVWSDVLSLVDGIVSDASGAPTDAYTAR